jgi:phosphatidylglycerol---prolipoprotein diacylglyceryl transferase
MHPALAFIPFPDLDPVIFRVGPLAARWYGVAYLAGFALAYLILRKLIQRGTLRITPAALGDLIGWLTIGVIVGGRAGYWIFYHRPGPAIEPWYEPLAIWHGGMSFHGGLVGVAVVLAVWSWARGASLWNVADAAALAAPVGLFFGRLANFVNAELVGRPTDVPWGVVFPGDVFARHPSQLYEAALEGPILLATIWAARQWLRPSEGRSAALFLILYGGFRFAVEFTREPDPQLGFIAFGWLTMGQLLSAILVLAGSGLFLVRRPTAGARLANSAHHVHEISDNPGQPTRLGEFSSPSTIRPQ